MKKNSKGNFLTILLYVAVFAAVIIFIMAGNGGFNDDPDELDMTQFLALVEEGFGESLGEPNTKVAAVQITEGTLFGLYNDDTLTDDERTQFANGKTYDFSVTVNSASYFQQEMASLISRHYGENVSVDDVSIRDYGFSCQLNPPPTTPWYMYILPYLPLVGLVILFIVMVNRSQNNRQAMSFGKNRAKTADDLGNTVTFNDVAGAEEEKQELREIVDFLRAPKDFVDMGARIPKGVLMVGPPGTGKTLLAKAVAGEAKVPFFSISSSEFVELYVGVGASRVRDLFSTAKRCAPSIIFIDEIDAVGRQRGTGLGGGHDEREQTLNQLLVEMDGFTNTQGIVVIAATNRADVLDPALLRPGRFDRRITVNYPDVKGRLEILNVHARSKHFTKDIDLERIAKLTPGCTGADLENILNEAAILAVRKKSHTISNEDVDEAIKRVLYGLAKKSHVITKDDLRITAYHEVGHAVVSHCLPNGDPVHELSIIPRGRAAGYTRTIPSDTYQHMTKQRLLDSIAMLLGGRAAETILLSDVSTGAQNDLMNATNIARSMVTEYGMSETLGSIYLGGGQEVFIGKSFAQQPNYSDDVAAKIDAEICHILETQRERAETVIREHREAIERVVGVLLEREQITGEEFVRVFNGEALPELTEKQRSELIHPVDSIDLTGPTDSTAAAGSEAKPSGAASAPSDAPAETGSEEKPSDAPSKGSGSGNKGSK